MKQIHGLMYLGRNCAWSILFVTISCIRLVPMNAGRQPQWMGIISTEHAEHGVFRERILSSTSCVSSFFCYKIISRWIKGLRFVGDFLPCATVCLLKIEFLVLASTMRRSLVSNTAVFRLNSTTSPPETSFFLRRYVQCLMHCRQHSWQCIHSCRVSQKENQPSRSHNTRPLWNKLSCCLFTILKTFWNNINYLCNNNKSWITLTTYHYYINYININYLLIFDDIWRPFIMSDVIY